MTYLHALRRAFDCVACLHDESPGGIRNSKNSIGEKLSSLRSLMRSISTLAALLDSIDVITRL